MTPASIDEVRAGLRTPGAILPTGPVVVGVSGGIDSIVLLDLLVEAGTPLIVVHVNYGLRGDASNQDEVLVRRMAESHAIPIHSVAGDARSRAGVDGMSVQEAARTIRYETFVRVAQERGAASVAVAHHTEDQVETVLLNLLRGSGPEGLAGMRQSRELARGLRLVRPLLYVRRAEIEVYARSRALEWREDVSNESRDYRRSVIRHDILPQLDVLAGGDAARAIATSAKLMSEYVAHGLRRELRKRFRAVAIPGERSLSLESLSKQPPVWQGRILIRAVRRWTDSEATRSLIADLIGLTESQVGRLRRVGSVTVWRERDRLTFRTHDSMPGFVRATIDEWGGRARVPGGIVAVDLASAEDLEAASHGDASLFSATEFVRADALTFPLTIRPWREGDRVQPLGMSGSKKVSDLLTDARVDSHARAGWPVMESAGQIVWVIGQRIAASLGRTGAEEERIARLMFDRDENDR